MVTAFIPTSVTGAGKASLTSSSLSFSEPFHEHDNKTFNIHHAMLHVEFAEFDGSNPRM